MATSGTNVFETGFPIDEVFEEAYERVGMRDITGYHLTSARRSLNIMLQEWANRGLHYWELAETNIDLIEQSTLVSERVVMAQVRLRLHQLVFLV